MKNRTAEIVVMIFAAFALGYFVRTLTTPPPPELTCDQPIPCPEPRACPEPGLDAGAPSPEPR